MRRAFGSLAVSAALVAFVSPARADSIAFTTLTGNAQQERLDDVEGDLLAAARSLGHEVTLVRDRGQVPSVAPRTGAELRAFAQAHHAQWTVIASITAVFPGQYRILFRVGYAATSRVEDLEVNVQDADSQARLRDVLSFMIRPEGLGDDVTRFIDENNSTLPSQQVVDEQARREAEAREREQQAAAQAQQAEAERRAQEQAATREWNDRVRYGSDAAHPWMVQFNLGFQAALARDSLSKGSPLIGELGFRVAHALPSVLTGFELRGGISLLFGGATAFGFDAGAAYLASPLKVPVFFGGEADIGFDFFATGAKSVAFMSRVSGLISWRPVPHIYLEAVLPELTVLTAAGGIFAIGSSARVGYQF